MPIRDVVLTAIIMGLLPVAFFRPWIGVLAWCWIGFMNPHKMTWSFAAGLPFAYMIALATLLGLLVSRDRKRIPWNFELVMVALLFADFTFSSFFAWYPEPAWDQWVKVGKILLMVYVMTIVIYGRERIWWTLLVIVLSIGFYGVKGAIFTITTGGAFSVRGPGNSFIGTNTGLGLALVMIVPLLLALAREEQRRWLRNVLRFTLGCSILSTPFTYSRGALLGLAAIAPFMFLHSKRKFLVLLILVPLAYFAKDLLPKELYQRTESIGEYQTDQSAQFRLQAWTVAWNIAKQHPITGAGFNFENGKNDERWLSYADFIVPEADNYARAAHSIYFQVLGQHGFLGLTIFLLLMVGSLWRLRRMRLRARAAPETEWIASYAWAIQLSLVGFMVSGAFLSLVYFDLVYTYLAVVALLQRELAAHHAGQTVERPVAGAAPGSGAAPISPLPSMPVTYDSKTMRVR